MPKKRTDKHKRRRKRKKAAPLEDDAGIVDQIVFRAKKLVQPQGKRKKRKAASVHPLTGMHLGLTPSEVDGPGGKGEYRVVLKTCLLPVAFALLVAILFPPNGPPDYPNRIAANSPFVTGKLKYNEKPGDDFSPRTVYNPKSTGIEFDVFDEEVITVRKNVTYARSRVWWDLDEWKFRNYQMVYIYAIVGRDIQPWMVHPDNGSYVYDQHLKTSLSGWTNDLLGEMVLFTDREVTLAHILLVRHSYSAPSDPSSSCFATFI